MCVYACVCVYLVVIETISNEWVVIGVVRLFY